MLENLTCNSCGAPIEVPDAANFVTCNHCSSQLAVRRTDNVTFTEELGRLAKQTETLSQRVDSLSLQNEVVALDREWEFERERHMVSRKNGAQHLPSKGSAIVGGIVVTVFGSFWTAMAIKMTSFGPGFGAFGIAQIAFPLFGVLFTLVGIGVSKSAYSKAVKYLRTERRYLRRRADLLRGIRSRQLPLQRESLRNDMHRRKTQ